MALWCGNNEIEQGMPSPEWQASMSWENYSRLFDHLLADLVRDMAPQTAYWPGSPHSPQGDRHNWMDQGCGDTHLWSVWHGKEPFEWYRTRLDRFCSEFGFQSFPEPDVVYEFTKPEDRNITSYVMEHHQRSGIGNSTIIHYLLDWFRLSTSFEATLMLSQILQGMAMKYAIEHWRRNMPRSMGTLYWQLNDMWPAPSWSSLDWKGNWKALHHMARKFFAPLLVSGLENATNHTVDIHVTSDLNEPQPVTVVYTVTDAAGNQLEQGELETTIAPRTNQCLHTLDVSQHVAARSVRDVIVWLEMRVDGETVSENLVLFSRPKHLELAKPNIRLDVQPASDDSYAVTLTADAAALYVWLELPGAQLSDNFFHLLPNQPRTIRVTRPEGMDDVAVAAALKVQSLIDTYL
jgi:beta-mannosidase